VPTPRPSDILLAEVGAASSIDELLEQTWQACRLPATLIDRSPWQKLRGGHWRAAARLGRDGRTHQVPVLARVQKNELRVCVMDEFGVSVIATAATHLDKATVQGQEEPCWVDPDTGLMWMTNAYPTITDDWDVANESLFYANRNAYAGFSDWRLPHVRELEVLRKTIRVSGNTPEGLFPPASAGLAADRLWAEKLKMTGVYFDFTTGGPGHNNYSFADTPACARGVRQA
jgi:hypothetical protein